MQFFNLKKFMIATSTASKVNRENVGTHYVTIYDVAFFTWGLPPSPSPPKNTPGKMETNDPLARSRKSAELMMEPFRCIASPEKLHSRKNEANVRRVRVRYRRVSPGFPKRREKPRGRGRRIISWNEKIQTSLMPWIGGTRPTRNAKKKRSLKLI